MIIKYKEKTCKVCKERYLPNRQFQTTCSMSCAIEYARNQQNKKLKKDWIERKKELKKETKTYSDYLNDLQKVFNQYINVRDKGKPCISCGCFIEDPNASHFFSVGSTPNLRFNEDNVHSSCIACNLYKHGNINEYAIRLPKRIGQERFEALLEAKKIPLKLSIEEIKDKIKEYKNRINEIRN